MPETEQALSLQASGMMAEKALEAVGCGLGPGAVAMAVALEDGAEPTPQSHLCVGACLSAAPPRLS